MASGMDESDDVRSALARVQNSAELLRASVAKVDFSEQSLPYVAA